jgi:zinc finger protein
MKEGNTLPFTFEVSDPSGNSFIQNPNAPAVDEFCTATKFFRTVEMYQEMGYNADQAADEISQD